MNRILGVLLFSAFLFTSHAKAALLVEPLVGYSFVNSTFNADTAAGVTKEDYSGNGGSFGGRLGYQKLGFQIGLDYLHSSIDLDDKDIKQNLSMNEWAAFVGFEFPVLLRVYAGYIFSADGETKIDVGATNEDTKLTDGTGMKAGVGFTLLPFLDINVEYRKGTFGEWKRGSQKVDSDVDYSAWMVGVSLPFTL